MDWIHAAAHFRYPIDGLRRTCTTTNPHRRTCPPPIALCVSTRRSSLAINCPVRTEAALATFNAILLAPAPPQSYRARRCVRRASSSFCFVLYSAVKKANPSLGKNPRDPPIPLPGNPSLQLQPALCRPQTFPQDLVPASPTEPRHATAIASFVASRRDKLPTS